MKPDKRPTAWQVLQVPKMRTYVLNYTNRKTESMTSLPGEKSTNKMTNEIRNEKGMRKRLGGISSECNKVESKNMAQKSTKMKSESYSIRHIEQKHTSLSSESSSCAVRQESTAVKHNNEDTTANVKPRCMKKTSSFASVRRNTSEDDTQKENKHILKFSNPRDSSDCRDRPTKKRTVNVVDQHGGSNIKRNEHLVCHRNKKIRLAPSRSSKDSDVIETTQNHKVRTDVVSF